MECNYLFLFVGAGLEPFGDIVITDTGTDTDTYTGTDTGTDACTVDVDRSEKALNVLLVIIGNRCVTGMRSSNSYS